MINCRKHNLKVNTLLPKYIYPYCFIYFFYYRFKIIPYLLFYFVKNKKILAKDE